MKMPNGNRKTVITGTKVIRIKAIITIAAKAVNTKRTARQAQTLKIWSFTPNKKYATPHESAEKIEKSDKLHVLNNIDRSQ